MGSLKGEGAIRNNFCNSLGRVGKYEQVRHRSGPLSWGRSDLQKALSRAEDGEEVLPAFNNRTKR